MRGDGGWVGGCGWLGSITLALLDDATGVCSALKR